MLTVLFATHNGAQTLARSLESYTRLEEPDGGYKIVIVDNASTDDTPDIVASFEDQLPITYHRNERQGKNIALNEGLRLVEGDLVVLTDDDVLPQADWLVQHRNMADKYPEAFMWGGSIKPHWPRPPADWILEQVPLGAVFALTDPNQKTGQIAPDMIWGPNMAVRRSVFNDGHFFDENVGPGPGQYIMGSETEFTCRVANAGYQSWFLAEAVVEHIIRENQVERDWVVKRAYRFGKSAFLRKAKVRINGEGNFWRGVPRWRYGSVCYSFLKSCFYGLVGNQAARFKADWDRQYQQGYISEAWRNQAK